MRYKFFSEPNMLVKTRKRVPFEGTFDFKPLFRFDKNGEYITEDEQLIEKLKSRFDHVEILEDKIILQEENKVSETEIEAPENIQDVKPKRGRK